MIRQTTEGLQNHERLNATIRIFLDFTLSLGIAIQNFPEGAIRTEGNGKTKSFLYGTLSGAVEPVAAVITILLTSLVLPFLPWALR